ncbi:MULTISPECIES: glycine--tRNA ligase subunit beta [Pseudoxanthomonas]|uniref:Glycine--tRNA ligase beta subunit n=1 Tax=Pseudoxanthomonas winnipegensis TaxID=2480810 RepID=A0AAW8GFJ7_9GAMM|nr:MULTISPECIES: glycine--tRNA ligase subunit beta [Pseudoxanthomonas]MDQ1120567.1 glycyl-tRNA synthetase beta chain [Pseudoxanthomonas winnipegensis]MDQ1133787.1 glycyl-tRNA synthetase beta chain [Pseudoxanthomonas winnipegensis]MDR6139972.1 glycyl-tRNA synthetase beta chain [Pseudoxanthomonas sp. SORGH_AS_0997]
MSEQLPLLIELGTEELPVKALPGLADALFEGIKAGLEKRGVAVDAHEARPLFTPRRLAVLLPGVAVEQPEQASEVFGPYVNIALDADGQPTKALSGFAAKAGVDWTQLERTTDAKGERFVLRATRAGARTADLLPEVIAEAVAAMPIPKPMRWGDHDYAFARPVQWLVALLGGQVIDTTLMGVAAGRESRGHRFEHDAPVSIAAPGDYVAALEAARVLVDPQQRRARIIEQVQAAARSVDGDARVTDDNLEQVVCLTEWPNAVACSFEPAFLAVPQEALIETMEINQKFFPVLRDGVLTEHFIGIANIASRDPAQVRAGYERVIRPRFADAKFFFDEDLKQGLVAMGEGLATVTYQAKLGTVADKVARVAALAQAIAPQVGADAALARRAAELSKNDLQSRMVGEFPELQGIAGRHYALAAGEPQEVALAIDEGYQPRFAGDDIALSPLGKVLAIAERLDTLAGGFAAGLKPTGNKDPFALRRNALGLARTIIESGFDLDLKKLLSEGAIAATTAIRFASLDKVVDAADAASSKGVRVSPIQGSVGRVVDSHEVADELYDFILDRLKGYYADKGVPTTQFNAVAELKPASLYDFDRRVEAIGTFAALPEAAALAAANKRIGNILKKAQAEGVQIPDHLDRSLIEHPAEAALAEAVQAAIGDTDTALHQHDYVAVLARLALLREQVDSFFDMVMVNAENPAVRGNRLALLHRLHARFGKVADIAQLSV